MSDPEKSPAPQDAGRSSRRDFLSGKSARRELERQGEKLADELIAERKEAAVASDTVRISTRAMNCEFAVILNPAPDRRQVMLASDALELVHEVESSLTVYRETSELLEINRQAAAGPVAVEQPLFDLLFSAVQIARETAGAFNPLARALNALWRECRQQGRLPEESEIQQALQWSGYEQVSFDERLCQISFLSTGIGFDLGGMGKGYALDRVDEFLRQEAVNSFLIHGGHSSILARGNHRTKGWPVGIRHPQFPQKRMATLLLVERGFSASGSGVQYFRYQGKRYGHLFDPRTGWPVDHMLSVIVTAPTAALADALSTAFSVLSQSETEAYCKQHPEIGVILFPAVSPGERLKPVILNLDEDLLIWE